MCATVVGAEILNPALVNLLTTLTKDPQWRVRMAIFELIGDFGVHFGQEVFQRSLENLFFTYLTNTAASVRKMGSQKSGDIAKAFGQAYITEKIIPKCTENYSVEQ